MPEMTIYHNPRCSKSRQTLQLLQEHAVEPKVVLYLDTPPTAVQLKKLLKQLGITAKELVRKGEDEYKSLNLANASDKDVIDAMTRYPKLIERPIVVKGDKAVLGRPPENILSLL